MKAYEARDLTFESFKKGDLDTTFESIKESAISGNFQTELCGPYRDVDIKELEYLNYRVQRLDSGNIIIRW